MASSRSSREPTLDKYNSRPYGSGPVLNNWVGLRPAKKDNPEREREATLTRDTTPKSGRGRVHTPHTYPRTKHPSQLIGLVNLRQSLPFDETSTENDDPLEMLSIQSEDNQSQDSGVQDSTPDSNQIVGRLMQIRDYLKQASTIKDSLEKDSPCSQEQLGRVDNLCSHLREQEEGYLALLQKMLADRSPGSEVLNNQRELGQVYSAMNGGSHVETTEGDEGEDSDVSLGVDAVSEVSECTTDRSWNAYNRPGIESHMGFLSDLSSLPNSTPTTSSDSSNPTVTRLAPANRCSSSSANPQLAGCSLVTDELSSTLTANNLGSIRSGAARPVQSNVDLYIADEVDGSFHHHRSNNSTRVGSKSTSPRLKQTNIPILNFSNQPFDELIGVEFAEDVMSSSDGFEVSTQGGSVSETQSDKEAEVRALKHQRDLLKKMLDQQRMLKSLHERQAELLELQRRADGSQEASDTTIETGAEQRLSDSKGDNLQRAHDFTQLTDEDKDRDEREEEEANDSSSDVESDTTDVSGDGYGEPPPTEDEPEVPAELQALRQRLHFLKNVFDENLGHQMEDQEKLESLRQMQSAATHGEDTLAAASQDESVSAGEESECSNPERRKLRMRLGQLQDKKQKMEHLLEELQMLRQYRSANDAAGDTSASESTVTGRAIRQHQELTHNADVTVGQAETVLDVMEQESKLRKLEEVRGKLDQLRDLVQYYQADQEEVSSTVDSEVAASQDLSLTGNIQIVRQTFNVADSVDDTSDADSNISLGDFGNDPEIQEKVRKLESARERLARLQSLVSMVQQWPETAEVLPEDLAELAATAMDDTASEVSISSKTSTVSGAQRFSALYDVSLRKPKNSNVVKATSTQPSDKRVSNTVRANQKVPNAQLTNQRTSPGQKRPNQQPSPSARANHEERTEQGILSAAESATNSVAESEAFYLQRMEEQKQELQNLVNERNKLLNIQQELKSLHHQYTQSAPRELSTPLNASSSQTLADNGAKNSARSAVTFSKKPDVSEPANDELYSRMLKQRMERVESRRSKGDDDQMTADVTTLGTWGDSESTSSDDTSSESDEENTPDDEGEIDEDDDGYPSDGILQVEEEEEANQESDRDTYTVENEYQFRQRYPVDIQNKSGRHRRPHTHKLKEPGNPGAGDYWKPLPTVSAVSLSTQTAHGSGTDMISTMKDQLDATTDMCQHLLQEQRKLALQMKGDYKAPASESWIENRVMYSINQLYSKIMDMQAALQVTVDQVYAITQHLESNDMLESSVSTLRPDNTTRSRGGTKSSQTGVHTRSQPSTMFDSVGNVYRFGRSSNRLSSQASSAVEQSDGDKTPTQPFPGQNSSRSEATTEADSKTESVRQYFTDHNYSIPPLDLDQLIKRRQAQSRSLDSAGPTYPSPSLSAIAAGRVRVPLESMYKPGISSGICGTAYAETASMSSAVSSARGDQSGNSTPLNTPGKESGRGTMAANHLLTLKSRPSHDSTSDLSLFEALRETIYSEVATLISQNENRPHFLIELFRELQMLSSDYLRQRGLYSIQELVNKFLTEDVSSQIQLDTDTESDILAPQPAWMLYRGTGSEQTPSESCVTTDEDDVRQMLNTKHKLTPVSSAANIGAKRLERVGSIKSDFADYIEQVETMSSQSTSHSVTGSALEDPFNQDSLGDTVIHLEKARQHATSGSAAAKDSALLPLSVFSDASLASVSLHWGSQSSVSDMSLDMPFAQSPLGDTAIDLQEAMQKVKDIDKRKEAKKEARKEEKRVKSAESGTCSSSSAQDNGSDNEGSTDVQMTRIDTQKLDRQIKQIMTEIIPVLREHMDNVCSSQLLQYVQQRVIELTAQTGDQTKPERAVEFTQFFQKQLFNILRDSLAKFEGRRMRDCGEEILVDISEILFNELAFFKLMQDLDDPEVKDRIALNKWRAAGGEAPIAQLDTDTDGTSTVDDSAPVISDEDTESEESSDEDGESEQEELGKDRDDAFADEVNTSEMRSSLTDLHVELAPSETKPMTRIGSDEDCSGDDDGSSEISTDDGDDTAISRLTAQDQNAIDQSESSSQSSNQSPLIEQSELGIDDLPPTLAVDTEAMAARAAAEEELLASPTADVLPAVSQELVGSGFELKAPDLSVQTESAEQLMGTDEPVVGVDEPVVGTDEPVVGTDAPVVGADAPVVGTDEPVVGTDEPVVGADALVEGTDALVVGTDAPVVGADAPVVGTDEPVVGTDEPVVGADALVESTDALVESTDVPVVVQPSIARKTDESETPANVEDNKTESGAVEEVNDKSKFDSPNPTISKDTEV